MNKLSAVIIAYNEARHIERCLQSLSPVADEILVVINNNTTDDTPEICKQLGAKIIYKDFAGYGAQKRYAVENAAFDLILSIDADEAIDDILTVELNQVKSNVTADAYTINIVNFYCGKWMRFGGINSTKRLRIFDRRKGNWNTAKVHEQIELSFDSNIVHLKGSIRHIAFESRQEHIDKLANYTLMSAAALAQKSMGYLMLKLLISSPLKFIVSYFIKLGFLEGWQGFQFAYLKSYETWMKYFNAIKMKRKS
jgi:glycosyltransferase involved in cell wall biosynthesis